MITEHLMRPGNGSVRFTPDVPVSVTDDIRALVDENASGPGASLVITSVRVDPSQIGDAATLAAALYTGPIDARPSRLSLECVGLSSWLDTYFDSDITRSSGTPTQWVGDLVANGITSGTITGGGNVSRTFPAHSASRRECLDAWAGLAGVEYRVNPDFTVDTAAASTLFVSPPEVVVTKRDEGPDGSFRGVEGGLLDQALTQLGPNIATKAVALAQGEGAAIAKGTATRSISLKDPAGNTPTIITVLSAPSEESANANTLASNFLNLQGMRRQVNVGSKTYALPRFVKPGDEVYVWDPEAGLYDTSNQIQFRGETIFPIQVRLLSYAWPIESGMGVYVRPNAASPTYIDVTDWVEWEDGSETWWTVGDWSPPSYGPTNRTAPEIEERITNGVGGDITGVTSGTGWTATLDFFHRYGPMAWFRVTATRTGGNLAAGDIANSTIATLTGSGATGSFTSAQSLATANTGPVVAGIFQASTGIVQVTATATGVTTSQTISLGGCVLVDL